MNILTKKAVLANVKLGHLVFEGLMVDDGSFAIAMPQLSALNLVPPNRSVKQLESLLGFKLEAKKARTPLSPKPVNFIPLDKFKLLLEVLAAQKHPVAYEMINGVSCKPRFRLSESKIKQKLQKSLGGVVEVNCLAGKIDLLTSTEVIEIKIAQKWKAALGQILVYGHYYPSHQKRIHLYGETQDSFLALIRSHCEKLSVVVTWES